MTAFGPGFTGVCIVMMLVLTMVSIILVTIRSFAPGHFKPAAEEKNDLQTEA